MSKPYGPIRRWLDKMGLISGSSPEQIPTAELPTPDFETRPEREPPHEHHAEPEPELLTEQEIALTTADTRPLPPEMSPESFITVPKMETEMESKVTNTEDLSAQMNTRGSGPLLDLGDFEPGRGVVDEDFVLDLDLDDLSELPPTEGYGSARMAGDQSRYMDERQAEKDEAGALAVAGPDVDLEQPTVERAVEPTVDPMAETQELIQPIIREAAKAVPERAAFTEPQILEGESLAMAKPSAPGGQISLEQLSPEAIDAIARRAVEMLSERAVQEIAWEVVPQLAELMIRRQLEEKNS